VGIAVAVVESKQHKSAVAVAVLRKLPQVPHDAVADEAADTRISAVTAIKM